ncbi:hypothetical protein SASPL_101115 [Salvia splendens]|uniref:Pentatricopeptide repeat-containing protein n=1 Tax=Salvia splendens TaxID=180675 RepID=A0A8X8YNN9_SALSN|nr:hypothetical protein SASPL_101115 [Salvia splendens]
MTNYSSHPESKSIYDTGEKLKESKLKVALCPFIFCLVLLLSQSWFARFRPFCEKGSNFRAEEVERVCGVIDETFDVDRNMEAVLDECGVDLSHELVLCVLRRHARKPAFRFFCWASEQPGYSHDSATYNAMVDVLGKGRQFENMVSLIEEMGEKGLLSVEMFIVCIRAFASAKERRKAFGVLDLMSKYKFKVGVEAINCLLDALGKAGLGKEADELFQRMSIASLRISRRIPSCLMVGVRTYTILINHLCKHGDMEEAMNYLDDMHSSSCEPDATIYKCLMIGFGNQREMGMVHRLLKEMREKGCPPDWQAYNGLIKMMTNQKMPDDAVVIYKRMIQSGIQPYIHTYNMLMKAYFVASNPEMGCAVWEEMKRKGCCPDENSYSVLIGGLIRQGRSNEAYE